ncbi:MAG: NAD-dependent epimerase/dehydratase family protein [Alphaproteobacteria bacterium]|nr:NAD-dependent epimerase/dehydratase family protein [Alphaproteobacteria bacterium]MDP6587933.1 NAD-dependent epimerase/dehydratase family protein [Alphaproteobacteria bacterium]MDP6817945.1 NAD-dependent epimerase/dehydratase family protein [Alphaproteobacteria bacterium]
MQTTASPSKVLLTGASGMVGRHVLDHLLARPDVGEIVSIGRRKSDLNNDKLREIVPEDFLDLSPLAADLADVDVCFHCLGVYQSQVSKKAYVEITCGYQEALTDALSAASPKAVFVLFGAQGAKPDGKGMPFARVKGRAENMLQATGFPRKYIFRPGYIHPTGARKPPGAMYRLILLPIMAALFARKPSIGITDRDLAQAMVAVGIEAKEESKIFSNQMIRDIAAPG